MHALFASVSIDPAGFDEARKTLLSDVVPRVKQSPGFVAAYWFRPEQKGAALAGTSVIVYDSEENAKQGEQMAKNSQRPASVTFTGFEIREVIASA
jgi:heme-degrading monooxygenase HmoA